ncbi:ShlB/FhaC/HecB family hemolysin secretion/activation protein [Sphingomonas sp.]|uniref:ShlB/FhaC/HecB family hemolysin secretion/activation protein n=1 Tax=Sphingomonas sp. TaxID=28214 RepID=UPI002DF0666F|nr:ShlB/FhaC/HecB family hemolysin secretion/activation protein [Sphingomonas sp.]
MKRSDLFITAALVSLLLSHQAAAQVILDRADPTITEQALPTRGVQEPARRAAPLIAAPSAAVALPALKVTPQAILVTGSELPADRFADVILRYVGRELDRTELASLVSDVAAEARRAGYPFATASIEPQDMAGGVLRVQVDEGRIDAVRVVGATSIRADRLLSRTLVTGRPVRRTDLERALSLVGDLPGVTVTESRLTREQGFSIMLVTIARDRASGYAQLDNRGSEEVGPIRSTLLGSARQILQDGDELAVLLSNTAPQLSEFVFLRGRYQMPFGPDGGAISVAGSYGRSRPGALLKPLRIVGESVDAAILVSQPIARTRSASVVGALELRHIETDQRAKGGTFRRDRLDTLTATLDGIGKVAGGTARGQFAFTIGLPLDRVSRLGEPLRSRVDGDARFVALGFTADWIRSLFPRTTLLLSASGQVASRALLATAEIGAGGPAFGRGYDFAERTGDEGLLGSAELRFDTGKIADRLIERSHLYVFADGGKVTNRGPEKTGGTLASAGFGTRLGLGRFEAMAELAFPLDKDRFDTGDKRPRISLRLSRVL